MESLIVIIGLAVISLPVLVIVLLVVVIDLRRRVTALEQASSRGAAPRAAAAGAARGPAAGPWDAKSGAPAETEFPEPEVEAQPVGEPPPQAPEEEAPAAAEEVADAAARTTADETPPPAARVTPPTPPRPSGPDAVDIAFGWLRENWFYAVSAVSLGLAGIFLVQYGIEKGLITPLMRVLLAMALGVALIVAGETIRRRWGDTEDSSTAYLPSTFSSAGLVVIYAAVLAARTLYGLIGPEMALGGLVAVSAVSIVFGWYYGPFMAAAGLSGVGAAPFLVGGDSESVAFFYGYYGLLAAAGLTIDAIRRWGWVSLLALTIAYAASGLLFLGQGEFGTYGPLLLWLALAAIALPRLQLWPSHPGPCLMEVISRPVGKTAEQPVPPVLIAAGAVLTTTMLLYASATGIGTTEEYLAAALLIVLLAALALWAGGAPGLADLGLIPGLAFLVLVAEWGVSGSALERELYDFALRAEPETSPPATISILLGLAAAGSLAAALRGFRAPFAAGWAAGAALLAPATAVVLELFWMPARIIEPHVWAGHVIALAALMTVLAERYGRADPEDRRRAAYAVLAALSLIALSLFILLSAAALTVALSVLVVAAAALDRRFSLPEMRWYILAGVVTLGWRLTIDPGIDAYLEAAPLGEVLLAFGSALGGLAAAQVILPQGAHVRTRTLLESAIWLYGGILATILLFRAIDAYAPPRSDGAHWQIALYGILWTAMALAQAYRLARGTDLRWLRYALMGLFGLAAALAFLWTLTVANPYVEYADRILGPSPADTLTVAYGLPALMFFLLASRARWLRWPQVPRWLGVLFASVWLFLEIRRFWHGSVQDYLGFNQPELYTYTVALLIIGGALLYEAIARANPGLRRLAMVVIGVTIVKVFFFDASGLTGLLRVFSFLALGLVLAGLAWLNRWASQRAGGKVDPPSGPDGSSGL